MKDYQTRHILRLYASLSFENKRTVDDLVDQLLKEQRQEKLCPSRTQLVRGEVSRCR